MEQNKGNDEEAIVKCQTTKGPITLRLKRNWSPNGYDRAVTLFERHFFDHTHFFRPVRNFLVQFGITYSSDAELVKLGKKTILDDPQLDPPIPFGEGVISYAGSGPNSRTSQLFIAYRKNPSLGTQKWETPIGVVEEGMENVQNLYFEYGDMPPWGKGPVQHRIQSEGKKYIEEEFPLLDKFEECHVDRLRDNTGANASGKNNDVISQMMKNPIDKSGLPNMEKKRDRKGIGAHDGTHKLRQNEGISTGASKTSQEKVLNVAGGCLLVFVLLLALLGVKGSNQKHRGAKTS